MAPDTLLALATFSIVSCGTPGPNNMMLLSSGATFGFRRTLPHIFGISGGCVIMVLLLGFGLAGVMARLPGLFTALHLASTAYLLYLAWRIATSVGVGATSPRGKPLSFLDAAAFQWANPKAWAMTLGAATSFSRPEHFAADIAAIALILCVAGMPCIMLWTGGGTVVRRVLARPAQLRIFNVSMGALLVLSVLPGLFELVRRV